MRRRGIIAGFVFATLAFAATDAAASTRVCRQLEAELAGGGGARFSTEKYEAAIDRQREQIEMARDQQIDAGCGFAIAGRAIRQCAMLNKTIARMQRNLQTLERDRKRGASDGPDRRARAQILASLEANGCRDGVSPPQAVEREILPDEPDGSATREQFRIMLDENGERIISEQPGDADAGEDETAGQSFRTMCVRSCDGYFYPMSAMSTVSDFDRDQKNCETSCPGANMQVFYGPANTDDPANMISTGDGQPYASLPTAFRHQQMSLPRIPSCGCSVSKDFSVIAGSPPVQAVSPDPAVTPASPPNAISESTGSFVTVLPPPADQRKAAPVTADNPKLSAQPNPPSEHDATDRNVRVVGPEFLPDPAGAIDLRAPAPRPFP